MARKRKTYVMLIVVLAGVSMLAASDRNPRARVARRAEPAVRDAVREADPYANRTVLVEAFVVQMDLKALYGMGVNPLGQAPHSVSVANLQEYLKTGDKANVLVGTKAAAIHGSNRNTAKRTETRYYPKTKLINTSSGKKETVDYRAYEDGETLAITPFVLSEDAIRLSYSFNYSGPRTIQQPSETPLSTVSWSWAGVTSLNVGQPRIVGATQDAEGAIFFVLTAHVLE
jgi:uncharacterized protein (UPF0333 family)